MTVSVRLWRIATDTPDYTADDLTGTGAKVTGGRWNRPGLALVYTASSCSLACLETVVHLGSDGLPLNRYLVQIDVPMAHYSAATVFDKDDPAHIGWDATPAGKISLDWGDSWGKAGSTLLAKVPSVIVPEDDNFLINPNHPDATLVKAKKVRKWLYDPRI